MLIIENYLPLNNLCLDRPFSLKEPGLLEA